MNTDSRVRPSSRPCSSTYSEPLNQANQIIPKTTANSMTPRSGDVLGEVVRRLGDDRHVGEVVEQLEVADACGP